MKKKYFLTGALFILAAPAAADPIQTQTCTQDASGQFSHLHLGFASGVKYNSVKVVNSTSLNNSYTEDLKDFPGGEFDITVNGAITTLELSYTDTENGQNLIVQEVVSCEPLQTLTNEITNEPDSIENTTPLSGVSTPEPTQAPQVAKDIDLELQTETDTPASVVNEIFPETALTPKATNSKRHAFSRSRLKPDTSYDFSESIVD